MTGSRRKEERQVRKSGGGEMGRGGKVHEMMALQIKYVFDGYKYTGVHDAPPIPPNGGSD